MWASFEAINQKLIAMSGIVVEDKKEEEEQIKPLTIQDLLKDTLIQLMTLGSMTFMPTIAPAFTPTSNLTQSMIYKMRSLHMPIYYSLL
jgi:hypothetical protein